MKIGVKPKPLPLLWGTVFFMGYGLFGWGSQCTNYDTPTIQLFQYENIDFLRYHNTVSKCYDTYNTITQAK